jgi:hypothetical protein
MTGSAATNCTLKPDGTFIDPTLSAGLTPSTAGKVNVHAINSADMNIGRMNIPWFINVI